MLLLKHPNKIILEWGFRLPSQNTDIRTPPAPPPPCPPHPTPSRPLTRAHEIWMAIVVHFVSLLFPLNPRPWFPRQRQTAVCGSWGMKDVFLLPSGEECDLLLLVFLFACCLKGFTGRVVLDLGETLIFLTTTLHRASLTLPALPGPTSSLYLETHVSRCCLLSLTMIPVESWLLNG